MTLDDRGRHSAERLRRSVQAQVDGSRTWAELQAAPQPRGTGGRSGVGGWQRPVATAAAIVLLCLTVTGAVVARHHSDSGRTEAGRDPRIKIGQALPSSPIDGKQSWKLPVVAAPQQGLRDGETISVIGRGFEPGELVGVVFCSSEADTEVAGIDACELGTNGGVDLVAARVNADKEGIAVAEVKVKRFITTPKYGRVDCQSVAERCLVGMGAVSNYDRSGGSYLLFDGSPPFPEISARVAPAENLAPGQSVIVAVDGSVPGRNVAIYECRGDRCALMTVAKGNAEGTVAAGVTVYPTVRDGKGKVECDGKCTIEIKGYGGPKGATSAPFPDPVPISFNPRATPPPSTTPTTSVPPTSAWPPVSTTAPPQGTPTSAPTATIQPIPEATTIP